MSNQENGNSTNLGNLDTWIRLFFMLLFGLLLYVAWLVIVVIAVLQFALVLMTTNDNENLRGLGQGLSKWCLQVYLFLTFNSEQKPFPFDEWPNVEDLSDASSPPSEGQKATRAAGAGAQRKVTGADDIPAFVEVEVEEPLDPDKTQH